MSKEFEDLLGQYWDLAHLEGKSGVSQGDKANEVLHALKNLAEQPAQQRHISYVCPQCYWSLDEQPAQQQEPAVWNVIDPFGKIVATEKDAIRGWARIQGYKPTVESLLGFQEQGWRVVPASPPAAHRTWVGLTDEEILSMSRYDLEYAALIGEVQRKLKEKNSD